MWKYVVLILGAVAISLNADPNTLIPMDGILVKVSHSPHLLVAGVAIEATDAKVATEINRDMETVKNAVYKSLSRRSEKELRALRAPKKFRSEILKNLDAILGANKIKAVYFTRFSVL